jgi:hypothetical protein
MKRKRLFHTQTLLALAAGMWLASGAALQAQAGLLAADSFDYGLTNGAMLFGQAPTNSTGFTGTWAWSSGTGDAQWRTGSLSYTDRKSASIIGTGGHLHLSGLAMGNVFMRLDYSQATIDAINANGGAFFSFLSQRTGPTTVDDAFLKPDGTNTLYPRNFGMRLMTTSNSASATIGQGSYGGGGTRNHLDEWAVANFDTVAYAPTGADFYSDVSFVVGKVDFVTNTISLWINPDLDDVMVNDGFVSATDTGNGVSQWLALGLEAGSDGTPRRGAEFVFDEFRMGTTWEAVGVPEPSTYALILGLLAGAFMLIRRRKA